MDTERLLKLLNENKEDLKFLKKIRAKKRKSFIKK